MYGNYAMNGPPPWWYPPQNNPQLSDPVAQISTWIRSLEELKKTFKDEKKPDDKKKASQPSVFGMMLLMILISPVTGPLMYRFFQLSLTMLPH